MSSRQIALGSQDGHWLISLKRYVWDPKEDDIWSKERQYMSLRDGNDACIRLASRLIRTTLKSMNEDEHFE